jgi:hypothetical protein
MRRARRAESSPRRRSSSSGFETFAMPDHPDDWKNTQRAIVSHQRALRKGHGEAVLGHEMTP